MFKKAFYLLFFICSSSFGLNVDSLINISRNSHDSVKMRIYFVIGWELRGIEPTKSVSYFNDGIKLSEKFKNQKQKAKYVNGLGIIKVRQGKYDSAMIYFKESLEIREKIGDSISISHSLGSIADCYGYLGNIEKSNEYYLKALEIAKKIKNKSAEASFYSNMAINYFSIGKLDTALQYFLNSLKKFEELNEIQNIAQVTMNISAVYSELDNFALTKEYLLKAKVQILKLNDKRMLASCYLNLGTVYFTEKDIKSALENCNNSITLSEEVENISGLCDGYNLLGAIYRYQEKYKEALDIDLKNLELRIKLNDKNALTESYIKLGISYQKVKMFDKSIEYLNKGLDLARKQDYKSRIIEIYRELSNTYYNKNDYKMAYDYYEKYSIQKDSLLNTDMNNQIAEMQTIYETDKKQKEIELLNKDKIISEAELKKQTVIRNSFIIGFIFILLIVLILYNRYIIKKKANTKLSLQNQLILQQKEEIEAQRDEILDKNEILENQKIEIMRKHDENEEQKKEILDSIHYAKRIQNAILPPEEYVSKNLPEHFILFKPRDIVSGDFYWAKIIKNHLIYCVADCTGHGVPGAFMSMLGIAFLNEIINKYQIEPSKKIVPSEILDNLREMVITSLHQTGKLGEQKDGMDISLVAIKLQETNSEIQEPNPKFQEEESEKARLGESENGVKNDEQSNEKHQATNLFHVQWAGANNPLWLVSSSPDLTGFQNLSGLGEGTSDNNEQQTTNIKLSELKPDKMPIGIYYGEKKPFTNHEFNLSKGDTIYIFSDGFADQFGGPEGKKFKNSQLKNIILDMNDNYIEDQKYVLDYAFELWKGDFPQIDDICIIGLKL